MFCLGTFSIFPFSVREIFLIPECRLTWFLPPHPPTGSVATRRYASHYCLSRNACFRYASVGLTSRPHHAHGALPAYVDRFACDWHRFSTTDPIRGYQKHYSSNICKIAMYFLNKMYEQMRFCGVFSAFMRSNVEIMRKKQGRVTLQPRSSFL